MIHVDYDDSYDFPKLISIDYFKNAADDEIEYKVENFTILTSGG